MSKRFRREQWGLLMAATVLVVVLVGLASWFVLSRRNQEADLSAPLSVGGMAPGFTLPSADGSDVSLSDYVGKTDVLLYFHMGYG